MTTNNTFAVDQLTVEDTSGVIPWADLTGGTILKVLFQWETEVQINFAANSQGYATDHMGIFTDEAVTPEQTIWTPNLPHGDFMIRASKAHRLWVPGSATYAVYQFPEATKFVETNVRRRIRENDRLFVSWYHFEDGTYLLSSANAWTGRVLVQLP